MSGQGPEQRQAIAQLGRVLGPDVLAAVQALYAAEQAEAANALAPVLIDQPYGPDARHRLDLYAAGSAGPLPVLLWVHGGGFVRGEKASRLHPYNAHIGRWAARHGMIGAVMNYRLAPEHGWPAGGEDVGAALAWLAGHVADHGGDPKRIVVMGTSAGAVHIATHLRLTGAASPARAAVLLSGLYGLTPLEERDTLYYGPAGHYADRSPREAMIATTLPIFLACAEFDPPRFQAETLSLLAARLERHGRLTRSHIAGGHNHFSLACHVGGQDTRLADEILAFLADGFAPPAARTR